MKSIKLLEGKNIPFRCIIIRVIVANRKGEE